MRNVVYTVPFSRVTDFIFLDLINLFLGVEFASLLDLCAREISHSYSETRTLLLRILRTASLRATAGSSSVTSEGGALPHLEKENELLY